MEEIKYIEYKTIYDWEFRESKFLLIGQIESDDFLKFECIHYNNKCILTIIEKDKIRYMLE